MANLRLVKIAQFYDNSILSGTKIGVRLHTHIFSFYDNSILSGTKIYQSQPKNLYCFTITQFFQVLKFDYVAESVKQVLR